MRAGRHEEGDRIRVLHVITGLGLGGAEMMLWKLLSGADSSRFSSAVISLVDEGALGERIAALGVPVHALRASARRPFASLRRLTKLMGGFRPDLVQGWMYHGNVAATLANAFTPGDVPVLWSIRQSVYDLRDEKLDSRAFIQLGAVLSGRAERILYNARISATQHAALGYHAGRAEFIPNGFDHERFTPSPAARGEVRRSLGLNDTDPVVGMVARLHPVKGHPVFLDAAARLSRRIPSVSFVLAGGGLEPGNAELAGWIRARGLEGRVHLLGQRADTERVMAALDVAALTSWAEGFPNVIGEAMACGVPCVSTNVGDAAWIIGDAGIVVPAGDAEAVARGWEELVLMGPEARRELGARGRRRVMEEFPLQGVVRRYEALYERVLRERRVGRTRPAQTK